LSNVIDFYKCLCYNAFGAVVCLGAVDEGSAAKGVAQRRANRRFADAHGPRDENKSFHD